LNYQYIPDPNIALRAIIEKTPAATLNEVWRAHPTLKARSIDHLALRLGQLNGRRLPAANRRP
jgi:hypothetical protein